MPSITIPEFGAVHRSRLHAQGVRPSELTRALETGALRRVRRDWFVSPRAHPLVAQAITVGGAVGCISAAIVRGVWAIDDGALHVSVPGNQPRLRRSAAGDDASPTRRVRAHWDDGQRRREAIVGVPRMLRQIARCQPEEMAVAAFDSSIRLGLLSSDELAELAASSTAQFRRIVRAVDGRADSGIESLPRVRLAQLGIEMVPQVKIDGHRVDGLVGERLVLQLDGFGPHSTRHQRNKDLAEDARLTSRGYTVLRFSYDQVIRDWEWVESEVLRAVEHGRHRWPM